MASDHTFTIRNFDDPSTADEIVASEVRSFHLERMDRDHVWIGITDREGRMWHIDITAEKGRIRMWAEDHGKADHA